MKNIKPAAFAFTLILLTLSIYGGEKKTSKKAFFEGYQLLQKGDTEKAIIFFRQAIKDSPKHAPTYSKLADCYEKTGNYKEAAPHWRKYIELRPRFAKHIGKHLELLDSMADAEDNLIQIREL
ncbi:MAG: tetratricopeptide repeat protein, partial [Planctomycetota bacterium]